MTSHVEKSKHWSKQPKILEINTWPWLHWLSQEHKKKITLNNVPSEIFESYFNNFDIIWLMGVWERSVEGRKIAIQHPELQSEYKKALSDFSPEDVVGSPYSIHDYQVDTILGGEIGLANFRRELKSRDKFLILDYVPNHLSVDHEWTLKKPNVFIKGTQEDLKQSPQDYFTKRNMIYAHGKDPYFPPWTDTVQINAFSTEARESAIEILLDVANKADGVRCDMAMLLTTDVFKTTWGEKAGRPPKKEFWKDIIPRIREDHPGFLFVAEVYWDMEWDLQQLGFDFCYDKRLYDRLAHGDSQSILAHLRGEWEYQRKLVRFIENHDEERAISLFGRERSMAAATIALTLPGARMVFEGQDLGYKIKLPVQLGRRLIEVGDETVQQFYKTLMAVAPDINLTENGTWALCEVIPIVESDISYMNLIAYQWKSNEMHKLIVVNFSSFPSKGHVKIKDINPDKKKIDEKWRKAISDLQELRNERNQTSQKIVEYKKNSETEKFEEAKIALIESKGKIEILEKNEKEFLEKRDKNRYMTLVFLDVLNNKSYSYNCKDIEKYGLYVDLEPWKCHVFEIKKQD